MKSVDAIEHINEPLWVITGPKCFPQLTLVKLLNHPECGLTIWGWSIYHRSPGFRTLGVSYEKYIGTHENAHFYLNREDAFKRLAELIPEEI